MRQRRFQSRLWSAVIAVLFAGPAVAPPAAHTQGGLKARAIRLAACGVGGWGGYKIGDKLAAAAMKRMTVADAAAERRIRLGFRVGTAAAACGASAWLAGTVYEKLSKRDREAREREMRAALADANPGTRTYVLPDSGYQGSLETLAAEEVDGRECRVQLDTLANSSEPVSARWCRKSPADTYEVDLGV